jgi:hypothetical protein
MGSAEVADAVCGWVKNAASAAIATANLISVVPHAALEPDGFRYQGAFASLSWAVLPLVSWGLRRRSARVGSAKFACSLIPAQRLRRVRYNALCPQAREFVRIICGGKPRCSFRETCIGSPLKELPRYLNISLL